MLRRASALAARGVMARSTRPIVLTSVATRALVAKQDIQVRGLRTLDFGGSKENIVERTDYVREIGCNCC
jgi:hypothetical protein